MTLDDLMSPLATDYPNANLTLRYDPFRTSCRWTATAYIWRSDGETPTEAIRELWATLAANTIKTLPPLPADTAWVQAPPSLTWSPIPRRNLNTLRGSASVAPIVGTPPPYSIVFDWSTGQERLYVPEGS